MVFWLWPSCLGLAGWISLVLGESDLLVYYILILNKILFAYKKNFALLWLVWCANSISSVIFLVNHNPMLIWFANGYRVLIGVMRVKMGKIIFGSGVWRGKVKGF
ncbi:hypothetical protein L1049_001228 [Liquidambar formosana]|uniref:Uncharacterized protein n=1 Tax=Liquidambar formosana TaxID=63359 RepID=A0AAP0NDW4_LIQFO